MNTRKENVLLLKSFLFAIRIVKLYQYLATEKNALNALRKQLLRSGTATAKKLVLIEKETTPKNV